MITIFIMVFISQGYKHRAAYIATQGPLKETAGDFWKMVWEYESKCIVMLCALEENGEVSINHHNNSIAYGIYRYM